MQKLVLCCFILLTGLTLKAQEQTIGIKTNVLYWGAITPNLGVEYAFARQWSLNVDGMYAPWTFKDNKKYLAWGIQPELRLWCCEAMTRHYVGLHYHYARFNIGQQDFRRDGHLMGAGLSYGYIWVIDSRWNIDFNIGLGYARLNYDKYRQKCGQLEEHRERNYWGPTKAGVTFVYKFHLK